MKTVHGRSRLDHAINSAAGMPIAIMAVDPRRGCVFPIAARGFSLLRLLRLLASCLGIGCCGLRFQMSVLVTARGTSVMMVRVPSSLYAVPSPRFQKRRGDSSGHAAGAPTPVA